MEITYNTLARVGANIAKGRGQKAEGRREKIDLSWFQYLARVKSRQGDCYTCSYVNLIKFSSIKLLLNLCFINLLSSKIYIFILLIIN